MGNLDKLVQEDLIIPVYDDIFLYKQRILSFIEGLTLV